MFKKSYIVNMTYDVSDVEKAEANKALIVFNYSLKLLKLSDDHLNIMKTPFKENPNMSPEDIMKARAAIRRFRDKSIDNFNEFKKVSFQCVNIMENFSSDAQTIKLMKSFISAIDELEVKVNKFADLFADLQNKDFIKNVVNSIESIQEQCDSIEEIVEERIKKNIQNNILASSWVDTLSDQLQIKIQKKTPLVLDLYNKREEELNKKIKETATVNK